MKQTEKRPVGRPSAREKILDAAEKAVLVDGAQSLRLEDVAVRAGVSKGGLFYHFPTKDDLLRAMVSRLIERSDRAEAEQEERLRDGPNPRLRAIIAQAGAEQPKDDQLSAALLVAVANDLSLLSPIRDLVRERFQSHRGSTVGFGAAATVELAIAGLSILEILGLAPLGEEDRRSVLQWLDDLASDEAPPRD